MIFPQFENEKLQKIADDCGLTIDGDNPIATSREIEFFVEQIIRECARLASGVDGQIVLNEMGIL
jgi:hypothetical protein